MFIDVFVSFCRLTIYWVRQRMREGVLLRTIAVVYILFILLTVPTSCAKKDKAMRKCWKRKYTAEITLPGVFNDRCKKKVTLHKCTGFCESTSGPVLSGFGVRWNIDCKCCIPQTYITRVVPFPECGASRTIRDIKNCRCKPC